MGQKYVFLLIQFLLTKMLFNLAIKNLNFFCDLFYKKFGSDAMSYYILERLQIQSHKLFFSFCLLEGLESYIQINTLFMSFKYWLVI